MTLLLWLALTIVLLAGSSLLIAAYGSKRWRDTTRLLMQELEAGSVDAKADPARPSRYSSRELEGLPAPVQRYFRSVLQEDQSIIVAANVQIRGTFNLSATGQQWKPFTSRQRVVTRHPGFLWDAEIAMLPGVNVRVVDSYVAGSGRLHAAVLGLFKVADVSGGGEIARGEFMRFFAEAVWYPTALLPSQGVRWQAVDDHSANASIVDGAHTLTLLFRFNDTGLIESFRAEARGGVIGKETVMAPWEGTFSNYRMQDGMTVPFTGEVAWIRPTGRRPYFVGTVTAISYEFAP